MLEVKLVGVLAREQAVLELEERLGALYDLAALARYCQVSRPQLRHALEQDGVPIIEVGRKQLVPRVLAERALGLDLAETLMEIHRNEQWMLRRELRRDGRRRSVHDYAEEMDAIVARALDSASESDEH